MSQFSAVSCLLLGLSSIYFNGSAAESYSSSSSSIGTRSLSNCSKGTSGCGKKHLMFPFPRVGRSEEDAAFPRSRRVIGIVKQPRIGRSDPSSVLHLPDSQGIYDAADDQAADLDYRRTALAQQRDNYYSSLDNHSASRRSNSPWAFFLITPNFHNTEHALDTLILPQLDRQLDSRANDD